MNWLLVISIVTGTQIILSALSAIGYACARDWPRSMYWSAATAISVSIRLIK